MTTFCDPIYTCLFETYICAFVRKWSYTWEYKPHKAGKNTSIRGKKTHVYRVAGMIASMKYLMGKNHTYIVS